MAKSKAKPRKPKSTKTTTFKKRSAMKISPTSLEILWEHFELAQDAHRTLMIAQNGRDGAELGYQSKLQDVIASHLASKGVKTPSRYSLCMDCGVIDLKTSGHQCSKPTP